MADPDNSLTPEQQLLKLIEEQGGQEQPQPEPTATKQVKPKVDVAALFDPEALIANILVTKEKIFLFFKEQKGQLNLKPINKILRVVLIFFGVYLGINFLFDMSVSGRSPLGEFDTTPKKLADISIPTGSALSPAFFENLTKRNVFIPYSKRVEKEPQVNELSLKLLEITKNFKLTGISSNPEDPSQTFCMIEDISKNVTTFLREGDTISGLRVGKIKEDSVVLEHQKDTMEIR